ncbi:TonB-dependent receptor family protein [Dyella mobilis]|uniref:TonB-dependent receptor n=1 Tax=Dyella mobilis TaxID=1849582 RepID=A0ABS2KKH9_9GAMM|nr:TonB-dependent receptor [Dyella mobilis]MBM7131676.1 TonB-dependent receptor [Dyella mobilis]
MLSFRRASLPFALLMALVSWSTHAQSAQDTQPAGDQNAVKATKLPEINVHADDWRKYLKAKLQYQMPEVDGPKITVTKKTTVTHLENQPTVIGNNLNQALARTPGVLVSEQPTPTQFNFSYRGIGNPQESEFVLVMQDGIPMEGDWIGFPTLYAFPMTQSLSEVQLIRGGSSLLYGPEPAPVINLVSKRPAPGTPLTVSTENVVGEHGLFSSYNVIERNQGAWAFRADAGYVHSDGTRANDGSQNRQADLYLAYKPDEHQQWWMDFHAISAVSGDPGRLSYTQWQQDPRTVTTPYNRDWVNRDQLVLGHTREFGDRWSLEAKLWFTYQDLVSRAAKASLPGQPLPSSTTLQDEAFRTYGADVRLRKNWGQGNALTVGTVLFRGNDPFRQWSSPDLMVARDDHDGTPVLNQRRSSQYESLFAENVFRLPYRIHIVPSVRLEHERIAVDETVRPPFLTRPYIHEADGRHLPLFGLGLGNDFGHGNETYFNVSQGWRPLRYFDIASPFSNLVPGHAAQLSKSLSWEAGVHGAPVTGLYYDVSLYWIDFRNRLETQYINAIDTIEVNTGDTRSRGLEGQLDYDFFARTSLASEGQHLESFVNVSLLNATFTGSAIPGQVGKTPAFSPSYLVKTGVTWRDEHVKLSLTAVSSAAQYWQDSDQAYGSGQTYMPARIPAYTVVDVASDWQLNRSLRLLAGISNIGNRHYFDRVWQNGLEPAFGRTWYTGFALSYD